MRRKMEPRKYNDMSNEDYHASPEFSSSQLKLAVSDIALFKKKYIDKLMPTEKKKAFLIGTMFHEMILEPKIFNPLIYPYDRIDRRLKAYKEFAKENEGKDLDNLLSGEDMEKLYDMKESLTKYIQAYELFTGNENEISVFFSHAGFNLRVRPDSYREETREIIDLKTTAKAVDYNSFLRTVDILDYDLSAAMYITGMTALTGKAHSFSWVVVQSVEPYSTAVYHMDESLYKSGMAKFESALGALSYASTEGYKVQHNPQVLSFDKNHHSKPNAKLRFGDDK